MIGHTGIQWERHVIQIHSKKKKKNLLIEAILNHMSYKIFTTLKGSNYYNHTYKHALNATLTSDNYYNRTHKRGLNATFTSENYYNCTHKRALNATLMSENYYNHPQ